MNETHETARSRRFSCTCGEVWEVDEDWERFKPIIFSGEMVRAHAMED